MQQPNSFDIQISESMNREEKSIDRKFYANCGAQKHFVIGADKKCQQHRKSPTFNSTSARAFRHFHTFMQIVHTIYGSLWWAEKFGEQAFIVCMMIYLVWMRQRNHPHFNQKEISSIKTVVFFNWQLRKIRKWKWKLANVLCCEETLPLNWQKKTFYWQNSVSIP